MYGPKNDLVHCFLVEYIKLGFYLRPEQFPQHWSVAWIGEIRVEVIFGKIEKCQQAGESTPFCLRLASFGELVHKIENVINGQISEFIITELVTESIHDERVSSNRIYFWNGFGDDRARFFPLFMLS